MITSDGIQPGPDKIEAIKNFPLSTTVKDRRRLLGMLNFYHRFLPKAAHYHAILYAYLSEPKTKDPREVPWSTEAFHPFETVKQQLVYATLLAFPQPDVTYCIR